MPAQIDRAGRSVGAFMEEIGLSRTAYYQIPDELKPEGFLFGTKPIITESPKDYVARIKERGGIPVLKRAAKAAA